MPSRHAAQKTVAKLPPVMEEPDNYDDKTVEPKLKSVAHLHRYVMLEVSKCEEHTYEFLNRHIRLKANSVAEAYTSDEIETMADSVDLMTLIQTSMKGAAAAAAGAGNAPRGTSQLSHGGAGRAGAKGQLAASTTKATGQPPPAAARLNKAPAANAQQSSAMQSAEDLLQCATDIRTAERQSAIPRLAALEKIAARGHAFTQLLKPARDRLRSLRHLVARYCLSFCQECDGIPGDLPNGAAPPHLQSVIQFENELVKSMRVIKDALKRIDELYQHYKKFESPFRDYILNYAQVFAIINETVNKLLLITEALKSVIDKDKSYPNRLTSEMQSTQQELAAERLRLQQAGAKVTELENLEKFADFKTAQNIDSFHDKAALRRELRKAEASNHRRMLSLRSGINGRRQRLKTLQLESGRSVAELNAAGGDARDNIALLVTFESRSEDLADGHRQLHKLDQLAVTDMVALKAHYERLKTRRRRISADLSEQRQRMNDSTARLRQLMDKLRLLQYIHTVKTHNDSFARLVQAGGYTPATMQIIRSQDVLDGMLRHVATELCNDWPKLCRCLPDLENPESVISATLVDGARHNLTESEIAYNCLKTWQKRSDASISQLVYALRKSNREELARHIETVVC